MPAANTDFHLTIARTVALSGTPTGDALRYTARVIESPVGQASEDFELPFTLADAARLSWRAGFSTRDVKLLRDVKLIKSPASTNTADNAQAALTLETFGASLFDAAFAGAVGQLFFRSIDAAEREGRNLRVQLQFDNAPEIAALPWEFLYSRELDRFLALSGRTPLVRYVALAQPERALAVPLPLRILVVVSDPTDVPRLDVEQEWTHLNTALNAPAAAGTVVIERLEQPTLAHLRARLRRDPLHILHFIGHGTAGQETAGHEAATDAEGEEAALIFEDETGKADRVNARQLATLLHDHATLRLVFLNSCHGAAGGSGEFFGVAQRLVQQGVPTVLAMQFAVSDRAAIALSREFYQSLSDGYPLESALSEARKAVFSEGVEFEWGTPVLYSRSPDGVIVAQAESAAGDAAQRERSSQPFAQLAEIRAGGDVIVANVGGEANGDSGAASERARNSTRNSTRNIVIGKNNVQINIGGHLMTLPFWAIFGALLLVVGLLGFPVVEPLIFPSQMSGGMNIAIADFGEIDAAGRIRASALGNALSKSVFDKLNQEYREVYPELIGRDGRSVEIWHDSLNRDVKNVRLGLIGGETPDERAAQAEALAERINAHMVIYGYLVEAGNEKSLRLDFFYAGATLRGEPDTVAGRHVLGEEISFPTALANEPMAVAEFLNAPLGLRARVLFWITVALIFDVTDQQERSLATLQEAETTLEEWDDPDGQALLHYFIGREAFWLRDYDLAISALNEAMAFKENYANAYIGLGAVHYDRANLFYTPRPVPEALTECISLAHIDRAAQSAEEAMAEIDRSIAYLEQAVAIAPDSPWPPIEFPARLALGHAYRLKGQAYLLAAQHELGMAWFNKSLGEFDLAQAAFEADGQQQYLAWTHLGRGATYQLQGYAALAGVSAGDNATNAANRAAALAKQQQAATLFQQAEEECAACLDAGSAVADLVYRRKVLRCGCEYLQALAQAAQAELQELMEDQAKP
jgi:tetratricopeptide (TPR) repeat protein